MVIDREVGKADGWADATDMVMVKDNEGAEREAGGIVRMTSAERSYDAQGVCTSFRLDRTG